ncbi:hypothetical protein [Rivularia sp. UHCC 0363]|uniref:hypothetical protein n=1 Tax=Rivularia sp. UHCC 0363 TaxID=3110244 RepID=UPI002B1F7643|nr:hypothetical protein [Rivularia sp. UHCC 0363]MEA5595706.1 hypothetical protein [Rivularia sp. UHCC 0363]
MNEFKQALCVCVGVAVLGLTVPKLSGINNSTNAVAQTKPVTTPQNIVKLQPGIKPQPLLKLTITVDDPTHLKVKEGEEIKIGQIIADNSIERDRLSKQRQSILLQINNLKSKPIPAPIKPSPPPPIVQLPPAQFMEEETSIASAQLKLQQAQSILESRSPVLQTDNPEKRAEAEKSEAALRQAQEKVKEQEELLKSMRDMKLEAPVIRHEEAKLAQLQSELDQAQSALERERAKLNASAVIQQQELQNLEIGVQLARSQLSMAQSRLETARNNRKLVEYKASIEAAQRVEQQNQSVQSYSQQQTQYAQSLRDRDYQLAQVNLSLSGIDDKLALIPAVRSPRNGYIRRIKNWTGNNGKYQTIVTISSIPKSIINSQSNGTN